MVSNTACCGQPDREKINASLSLPAPENLVSRDTYGRPVMRQPVSMLILHTQAESGFNHGISPAYLSAPAFIHSFVPSTAIGSVPR